jgi:foldase protein PrsA
MSFQGSQQKFDAAMKKSGVTLAQVRDDVRQGLIDSALQKRLTKNITVSNAEVKAYYTKNKTMFSQPESRTVRHILVKTKALADKLYGELQNGADFATLAKKYSTDTTSAQQGGKLTVGKGQTVPPFNKVAFSLTTGQMSPPVHSKYGWHIIQALSAIKSAGTATLAQVGPQIKQQLLQEKQQSALSNWMQKVANQYRVTYAKGYAPPINLPGSAAGSEAGK